MNNNADKTTLVIEIPTWMAKAVRQTVQMLQILGAEKTNPIDTIAIQLIAINATRMPVYMWVDASSNEVGKITFNVCGVLAGLHSQMARDTMEKRIVAHKLDCRGAAAMREAFDGAVEFVQTCAMDCELMGKANDQRTLDGLIEDFRGKLEGGHD